jgi:hypothetical protein
MQQGYIVNGNMAAEPECHVILIPHLDLVALMIYQFFH